MISLKRATTFKQGKHSAHFNIDSTSHDDSTSDFNYLLLLCNVETVCTGFIQGAGSLECS